MTSILVVDDSQMDRSLVGGLLTRNTDYKIEYAEDGKQALERLAAGPPDLVVTDLVMPEMDGLQLVRSMQRDFPQVPVILMTAHGNEEIAAEALLAGAASYVPKTQRSERLQETILRVLARLKAAQRRPQVGPCLTECQCRYLLENNPALLPRVLDHVQQILSDMGTASPAERIRIVVALEEAMLNAMYHGNLEIGEQELSQAREDAGGEALAALVEQRRMDRRRGNRKVLVKMQVTGNEARFVVRDEGEGFNPDEPAVNRLPDCFERGRGRGLLLMRSLMDDVRFNDRGNEVTLCKMRH